ncbi:hypothetical protein [Mesonia sp. HuA40]|uniref:hypothetical protein n=1 Tax=Mesonia sp. HuA40 TaxID=2602761 RepID=UPI0011CAF59A|nr:hypothetical protein [Mesonia sp. HuA40]TXK73301.1 hypothetical protein FT993_05825 [Mesonia sp. HuA40]
MASKTLKYIFLGILLVGVSYFGTQWYIEFRLKQHLSKGLLGGELVFKELDVRLWQRTARLTEFYWHKKGDDPVFEVEEIQVKGVQILKLVFENVLAIDEIQIDQPKIVWVSNKSIPEKKAEKEMKMNAIRVKKVHLQKGSFKWLEQDRLKAEVNQINLSINNVVLNNKTVKQVIPINYDSYRFELLDLFLNVNTLQDLKLQRLDLNDSQLQINNLTYTPKYSRAEYVNHIPYEKDLINLKVERVTCKDLKYSFGQIFSLYIPNVAIQKGDLQIYRDKTIKDDVRQKKLYSEMLRKLPFNIKIDSVDVHETFIKYQEKLGKDEMGEVSFEKVSAVIKNLVGGKASFNSRNETKLELKAEFTGISKLDFKYSFLVADSTDAFQFKGSAWEVQDYQINKFFIPALGVQADGSIDALHYNFSGNRNEASGEMIMNYDELKFDVLKNNGKEKKVMSWLANILVNNKNKTRKPVEVTGVQRDKTKSFWNFYWRCLQKGLKKELL